MEETLSRRSGFERSWFQEGLMVSDESILSKIADVIQAYNRVTGKSIRCTGISMGDHFCNDLGGQSMDLIEMILALEDAFDVTLSEEDFADADPWELGNLVKCIASKMMEAGVA
jgi:acyl carrier protein